MPQLVFGGFHACALSSTGGVKCWGDNSLGQLGDGSTVQSRSTPADVPALTSGVASIAAGYHHTCALMVAGGVRCWGANAAGQLGDGTSTLRRTPTSVLGLAGGLRAIATGNNHNCVLMDGGALKCWGENFYGQLGMGDGSLTINRSSPVDVATFASGALAVAVGGHHTCAIRADGSVWCWGQNWARQLGTPTTSSPTDIPRAVPIPGGAIQLSLGWEHTCALTPAHGIKCWGLNDNGQLGNGPIGSGKEGPVDVTGLTRGVASVAAGYYHTCAITESAAMMCWGSNAQHGQGKLGDGTDVDRATPQVVSGLGSAMRQAAGGWGNSGALGTDGSVLAWGLNQHGEVGDGTLINRFYAQLVVGPGADGFLDLTPETPAVLPAAFQQSFPVVTNSTTSGGAVSATSQLVFRPQDAGTAQNLYVFALAPRERVVLSAAAGKPGEGKIDLPLPCVLAQLTGAGVLTEVSAASIQAYVGAVQSAKGATVGVLNAANPVNLGGATFFVGYGTSAAQMLDSGTNRGVVAFPGTRECRPQPPQNGWWWNPAEGGRGYSIEVAGNRVWVAAFLYDATGRSTWHVFGGVTALDGSLFSGRLYAAAGGQSLFGAYRRPAVSDAGAVTIAFTDATHGTLVWPGGSLPIERFNIVPGGLAAPTQVDQPEGGWWWNPQEDGRGFFIEWQNGWADIAGYMYDEAGNPLWYLSVFPTSNPRRFEGKWWQYANGQTLTGAYRPAARVNENVAPAVIDFTSATEAVLTLPGGRQTRLTRYRF